MISMSFLNGSHFGLPPNSIHKTTRLGSKDVWTMAYAQRPYLFLAQNWYNNKNFLANLKPCDLTFFIIPITLLQFTTCRERPAHLRLLPVRHFVGIARYPHVLFQSRRPVPLEALALVPSVFVMMDEERVFVLSLEDDVDCVVAVEERELLAESGRARHTAHTFPCVPFVSIL